jgi:hypothetical protein
MLNIDFDLLIYPSTKRTTALAVGELVLWYGMFAPAGRNDGTTGLPVGRIVFMYNLTIAVSSLRSFI